METTTEKMKNELTMAQILNGYIKHKNGAIFQILEDGKSINHVFLRSKNRYTRKSKRELKQGVVDGRWFNINEHEWRKWVKQDNAYIELLTQKLLKRVIYAQLLIELDDELVNDFEDMPQFRKLLERTNKESERIAAKQYDRLYSVDKKILQNLMTEIDNFTSKVSKVDLQDLFFINKAFEEFFSDPKKYRSENVELTDIE